MKIYISADIEGVGSVCAPEQLAAGGFEWEAARRWMTAEVNAAAAGARAAGATEVIVSDSHGNAMNLLPDELDPDVRLVRGFPRPLLQLEGIQEPGIDACMFVGYHVSTAGIGGVLSHTYFGGFQRIWLNGQLQSEGMLNAALAGEFGVPVIFMSGDRAAVAEIHTTLPGLVAVVTKSDINFQSATMLSPSACCRAIRDGAERAVATAASRVPYRLPGPYTLDVEFKRRGAVDLLELLPGFERVDPYIIRTRPASLAEAMRVITFYIFGLTRPA